MKTITIQIGNSDNKLTQLEWAEFVSKIHIHIHRFNSEVHFFGGPENWQIWQNVAWVFSTEDKNIENLKNVVKQVRAEYKQDSVAFTIGKTEFV